MNKKIIIVIYIMVGILLFSYLGYRINKDFFSKDEIKEVELDSIKLYGYSLKDNDGELFKKEFKVLRNVLDEDPVNYEEYAKSISKLFIIDLYSLNNKKGSTDIGGTEFIHEDLINNFRENMGSTLYKYMENNINGDRTTQLPEVNKVDVLSIDNTTYKYNNIDYEGYLVKLNWEYIVDLGYQTSIELTLINDNNKLYVVKGI